MDMKETKLKMLPSSLENLIFFVEVRTRPAATHSLNIQKVVM